MEKSAGAQKNKQNRKVGKKKKEENPLPEYLRESLLPPIHLSPPVQTRPQELPFEQLSWDYFERLCKVLIETDQEIRSCRLYGRRGQNQKGIDLIAYPKDFRERRPRVYQCKRVEIFQPNHIKGVVDKFLQANWKPQPSHFVLCCKASLQSTGCQDEILKQTVRLEKHSITFEQWDKEELSQKLKEHDRIVDDFFGRPWVLAFNGSEAAEALDRRFENFPTDSTERVRQVERLLVSKELELFSLTSTLDRELSEACDKLKERYKQGWQSEVLGQLQSYIDRFQTDLAGASSDIRTKFWYTFGVFSWTLPNGQKKARQCLEKARQLSPTFDLRSLEARVHLGNERYEEALEVLQPADTLPTLVLSLAILLDLRRVDEFDTLWKHSVVEADASVYQLLAYRYRLDRKFDEAYEALQKAIDQAPNIPDLLITTGNIKFWEAVPEHMDGFPRASVPATLHPAVYSPTGTQLALLEEAAKHYQEGVELLRRNEGAASQIQEGQSCLLLCYAFHPNRQHQAASLALDLLNEDPTNFSALFYCYEWKVDFDIQKSTFALEDKRRGGNMTIHDLHALVNLYTYQSQPGEAIRLLEEEKNIFVEDKERSLWVNLLVDLLIKEKEYSSAEKVIEDFQVADPLLKRRLQAQFYEKTGSYDQLEALALEIYEESGMVLDLLNLCGFYRKTEQWEKLEKYAEQLVRCSSDPRSESFLIHALYHRHQFEECLSRIKKHTALLLDHKLSADLQRIEIECLFQLNRLESAVRHLETLLQEHPSAGIAHNLAHAYIRMGKREKTIALLKESSEASWADTSLRLTASQVLLREDPQESYRLAQLVKEEAADNPEAWLHYIQTAFYTGHDREASETLFLFQNRFPETSLLQRFQLDDFIEKYRQYHEERQERWRLYQSGSIAAHLVMDADRQPLGLDWFVRFRQNTQASRWDHKYTMWVRHGGGRPEQGLQQLETDRIVLDYTSLLLAYELDLLPLVEEVFSQILIAPSLLSLIELEGQRATEYQRSRLEAKKQIQKALERGRIKLIEEAPDSDVLQSFQINDLGKDSAFLFYLAEKHHGFALARHLLKEEERNYTLLEPLARLRVFPFEVVTALYQAGELAQHEFTETTKLCQREPCRSEIVQALAQQRLLITDIPTAEFFADLGLFDRLTKVFQISMTAPEAKSIARDLQAYQLQQEAAEWLDGLRSYVSRRLEKHYFFPSFPISIEDDNQQMLCTRSLQEVFHIAETEQIPLWIDDRWARQYERMEQAPIVGTETLLFLLNSKGLLSEERYYLTLLKLLERNALFLSLNPGMVIYFLKRTETQSPGRIQETYELKTIRRYFAAAFSEDSGLNIHPSNPQSGSEATIYWQQYEEGCLNILLKIWLDKENSANQKTAMSEWIVNRLRKGMEEIFHFLPNPPDPAMAVSFSQYSLIQTALQMCLQDMRGEHVLEDAAKYLRWVYTHFLGPYWQVNPEIQHLTIDRFVQFLKNLSKGERQNYQQLLSARVATLLLHASPDLVEVLFENDQMKSLLNDNLCSVVKISEELEVPEKQWNLWVFECIDTGDFLEKDFAELLLNIQWYEPSPFLSYLRVQWSTDEETQRVQTSTEPFLKLRHPSAEIRQSTLKKLIPFLSVSSAKAAELQNDIGTQAKHDAAALEVETIGNSSWKYFWGRLKHLIEAQCPTNLDHLFPKNPLLFRNHFPLTASVFKNAVAFRAEWLAAISEKLKSDQIAVILADLCVFPFGGEISLPVIVTLWIDTGKITRQGALDIVQSLATRTSNPIVLQNCLNILITLRENEPSLEESIKEIVLKLLAPRRNEEREDLTSWYELYIVILHFAWSQMQIRESFREFSIQERIVWTYSYAGALIEILDDFRTSQGGLLEYTNFSRWLQEQSSSSWRNIFEGSFHEQLEVSHPLKASFFRTVISGTWGVLHIHKDQLSWLRKELLPRATDIAQQVQQNAVKGGEEIFKRFNSTDNFFAVPSGRNVFLSLKGLFDSLDEEDLEHLEMLEIELFNFVREFDPNTLLTDAFHRILDHQTWSTNDLISIYVSLDEPLKSSSVSLLRQGIAHMDLSSWSEDREFTLACMTLAQGTNASSDPEIQNIAIDKLKEAWAKADRQSARYIAILGAVLTIFVNTTELDQIGEFYKWLDEAIRKMEGPVPEELFDIAVSLNWQTSMAHQKGLLPIKSRLLLLL